jgi:hypothetical protein
MSCSFDQLVGHVALLLAGNTPADEIDRFLETLLPAYRAEVLDAAREVVQERQLTRGFQAGGHAIDPPRHK